MECKELEDGISSIYVNYWHDLETPRGGGEQAIIGVVTDNDEFSVPVRSSPAKEKGNLWVAPNAVGQDAQKKPGRPAEIERTVRLMDHVPVHFQWMNMRETQNGEDSLDLI